MTGSYKLIFNPLEGKFNFMLEDIDSNLLELQGDWNANTNTPDISGETTVGHTYYVTVAGNTNLGGKTNWEVGDMATKSITGWIHISGADIKAVWGKITGLLSDQTDLSTALGLRALDSNVVHKTTDEAIAGKKTFSDDLYIGSSTPIIPFGVTGSNLFITSQVANATVREILVAYGNGSPALTMGQSGGTFAAPSATQLNSILGSFSTFGHDGNSWTGIVSNHRIYAAENFSSGTKGTYQSFFNIIKGTTTSQEVLRLRDDGSNEIIRGKYRYDSQTVGVDTIGDWRTYSDASGYYTQYCTVGNATKGSGTWVTKSTVTI